jgi:cobalt/nickel transport system permease protein
MHIPDGFLSLTICAIMYALSIGFLVLSWKKAKNAYSSSFTPMLAVSSAFVFAAQMINFPILYGTSGHLVGGTFLSVLLGPYMAILGLTIVLMMQALIFADGGLSTFGANVFNMAVIGGLSYFIVKSLKRESKSSSRFFISVFAASWISMVAGAIACGLQIGFSPLFSEAGGVIVTVPAMLFWHILIGFGEAAITATLLTQLKRMPSIVMPSFAIPSGGRLE